MPPSTASQIIRFDIFELDLRSAELRKHGIKIRLQDQPFRILCMLLENPGEIVTTDELQKKIWAEDTFVDFDHGLHAAVGRLREKLGDSAEKPRYIETVPRRGYRFIGTIVLEGQLARPEPLPVPGKTLNPLKARPWVRTSWTGAVPGFLIAIVLAAGLACFNVYGLREWLFGTAHPRIHSLAVLPLEDVHSDAAHDYISEGITEDTHELILDPHDYDDVDSPDK